MLSCDQEACKTLPTFVAFKAKKEQWNANRNCDAKAD